MKVLLHFEKSTECMLSCCRDRKNKLKILESCTTTKIGTSAVLNTFCPLRLFDTKTFFVLIFTIQQPCKFIKINYENQMNRAYDNAQSRFMERESEMKYECI